MLKSLRYLIYLIPLTFMYCAHKGLPLHIDRIDPKIKKVTPANEHQIILDFSEDLDTLNIKSEDFVIYANGETLKVLTANLGNTSNQIFLTTEKMKELNYYIQGKAYDRSGRTGFFKSRFFGSTKPDTIVPWLTKYSKGSRLKYFYLRFSEPVDTVSFKYYVFPKKSVLLKWQNMKDVYIVPSNESDSFSYDTTYYLYLEKIKDLSGNQAPTFITTITPDTAYNPLFIKGRALLNDTVVPEGVALLERFQTIGISPLVRGEFLFEVRDSLRYFVRVFSQNFCGQDSISVSEVDNIINLFPGVVNLDSIID